MAKAGVLETYRSVVSVVYPWHIGQIGHMNVQLKRARAQAMP